MISRTDPVISLSSIFFQQKFSHFLLAGQLQLVLSYKEIGVNVWSYVFHHLLTVFSTKQQTYRWIVICLHIVSAVVLDVHIKLSQICIIQTMPFQFHDTMTFQYPVIKHEVSLEVVVINEQLLLPGFQTEPHAQFHMNSSKLSMRLCSSTSSSIVSLAARPKNSKT